MTEPAGPVDLGPVTAAWVEAAKAATAEIARWAEIRDRAYERIKDAMGDSPEARIGGRPAVSWAWSKPARYLDAKALAADLPDIAAKYTAYRQPARPFKILDGGQP
jgi:hypothetical protein